MPGPYPLQTLGVIIGPQGISAPTFEDILQSFIAAYQQIYGSDVYLGPDSQDFQWLAVQSQIVYDANQAVIMAYLSYSPTYAQGIGLSSVVKINGIRRLSPSSSSAEVNLIGQAGTTVNNGVVQDVFGNNWNLPNQVIIPTSGEITVTATAQTAGAIAAAPGTIIRMQTMVPGWQSVSNAEAAAPGLPVESDATLRKRQTVSTSLPAITPRESILGAVANIPGVGRVEVYDNDTDFYDYNGVPPHSISVIVEGGDALTIATTILNKKNTGCGTYGDVQIIVTDSMGVPQTINYYSLTLTQIYVTVAIKPLPSYQDTTAILIQAAVAAFISDSAIGSTVYNTWLYSPANLDGDIAVAATGLDQITLDRLSQAYVVQAIYTGTAPNPTSTADIPIAFNGAAAAVSANIVVSVLQ